MDWPGNKLWIVFALAILVVGCGEKGHPSDADMIRKFNDHRDEFDTLVSMFKEDRSLGRVGANFTRTSNFFEKCSGKDAWEGSEIEVTRERLHDYDKRFADLGLTAGIEGYCEKESIVLYASTRGLSVTGSSKGYAYLGQPPKIITDNLDSYWSEDGRSFTAYRHIDGNWYLYFDYED
ncbi:MAG: hypothetical protein ABJB34_06965 [Acidobacteriota bacterium]